MLIENVEALKTWLVQTLTPICDADPGALAKYVVALVKKDKSEQELKDVCTDQLEVFLQSKTKSFVDQLFESLESKEYIQQAALVQQTATVVTEATTTTTTSTTQVTADNESKTETKTKDDTTSTGVKQISKDTDKDKDKDVKKKLSRTPSPRRGSRDLRHRLEDRRLYRRRSRSPRGRRGPRSRSRSPRIRSRSPNRSRSPGFRRRSPRFRSRSPRNRSRSPRNRSFSPRNRSLSPRKSPGSPRNRSRSPRNRSRSPRNWSKSPRRSRSPRPRSRSWSRSRSLSRSWSRSRSRSRSPRRRRQLPDSRGSTPTQDNGRYGPSSIPTIGGVYSLAHSDSRYTMESTARGNARPRCIDYDEKGFCMRGDLCPFDHGLDPVVVEDVSIPPPPFSGPPPAGGPRMNGPRFMPPGISGPGPRPPMPPIGPRPEHFDGYNPEAPAIDARPPPPYWVGPRGPPPPGPHIPPPGGPPIPPAPFMAQQPPPSLQSSRRDLVSIQTMPAESADKTDDQQIAPPGTEPLEPKPAEPQKTSPTPPEQTRTVLAPKRSYDAMEGQHQRYPHSYGPPQAKKPFDYNRVGGYRKPGANNSNCALVIKNIPKEYNNIGKLNEHFGKFGTIVNLQINLNGDPDASLVTMSSNAEAYAAYKSSEPVFNNRFIKVFWYKPESANTDNDSNDKNEEKNTGADHHSVKSRLGPIPHPSKLSLDNTKPKTTTIADTTQTEKSLIYTSSVGNITKTVYNPNVIKAKAAITSPTAVGTASFVSKIEAIKRQEDLKKEALKKKEELQKQKQELLTKQLEQQKMLIQKLEKNKSMSAEDKAKIMETLKALSATIEKTKSAITPTKPAVVPAADIVPLKSPDEARKEILDTELELFTKQHSGEDTTELKKKLADLTVQAASMGLLGRGRARGRGSFVRGRGATTWVAKGLARGRGRGAGFPSNQPAGGSMSIDKRPKVLDVTGFTLEDKNMILPHFAQFATVEKVDFDETTLTATVVFKTRMDAEKALLRGGTYQNKQLIMKWHTNVEPKVTVNLNISSDVSFAGDGVDSLEEGASVVEDLDEDELLAIDDEEEDVEESRSWRR